jgi:hemerythrin-like domain-containing protein
MADVVELIEQDHRAVEQLFAQFEASNDQSIAEAICAELTKHTHAEENAVYPVLARELSNGEEMMDEAEGEHEEARQLIGRIRNTTDEGHLTSLMAELKQAIEHHVLEEETEILPQARQELSADMLSQMGSEFETAKQRVPQEH